MEVLEKIKNQIAEFEEKRKELVAELQLEFGPMLKPLFEKSNGKINSIGWTQYTPYFNDGDECTFGVQQDLDYRLRFNGVSLDEDNEEDGERIITANTYGITRYLRNDGSYESWIEKYPNDAIDPIKDADQLSIYKLAEEFKSLLSSVPEEFYRDLFGDHVLVTIHSDGRVETEKYDHD